MPPVSILIKPSSSGCNLQCKYCFYRTTEGAQERQNLGFMRLDTLEQLVKNALSYAEGYCCFAFQGGEPTLCGLDFYQKLMELERRYNTQGLKIEHTIQTNGVLLDDEWAAFFAKNDFLVGLSLDGPRKINDAFRVKTDGSNTFDKIMSAAALLKNHGASFNILSVITSRAAEHPEHLYRFFKKQGFDYLQFIPCIDEQPGSSASYSLRPGQYGTFLSRVFDLWADDFNAGRKIDIRFFSNLVQMAAGYAPEACGMCGHCTPYPVVEGDGSVYPCDFYVSEQWRLGTVWERFADLLESEKAHQFVATSEPVHESCRTCEHFDLCRGGCRRWREPVTTGIPALNCLCEDYKFFFNHSKSKIREMAQRYLGRVVL